MIKNTGKSALDSVRALSYHRRHEDEVARAIHVIEKHNAEKLSAARRARADQYAVEILGSKKYAPWLYVYTLISGDFKEGWIPDNFFGMRVDPEVNKRLRICSSFKTFSNTVLSSDLLPDIGYHIDALFYDRQLDLIAIDALSRRIFSSHREVFVKKDGSGRGEGIHKLAREEFNRKTFREIGNCVIQSPVVQHPFFDEIVRGSVATVRITTVKDPSGKIDRRAAYLRLGRKGTPWVQSGNSFRVAILNKTGRLDACGYTQDWRRWERHPDTNYAFAGKSIPRFKEAVEECVRLHRRIPHFAIIGWDVAIDADEKTRVLEWNAGHCDIKFSEATTGPCFLGLNWEKYGKPE